MSTVAATVVALVVLSAAGLVPVAVAVGPRWVAVPLAPLGGAVVAAVAATASLSFGGALIAWFMGLAVATAVLAAVATARTGARPWAVAWRDRGAWDRQRLVGLVGFGVVVAGCAWSLRGLRSPTVGFDARALWVMRPGWFLQSHGQLLVDMRTRGLVLTQSAYPPLVSAVVAVAWQVTGVHTDRLGVTTVAVLNGCALAAAALAVVECGRIAAGRLVGPVGPGTDRAVGPGTDAVGSGTDRADGSGTDRADGSGGAPGPTPHPPWTPMVTGVAAAVLLVVVAAGVTEPFLTNGYADPIWSLAAVGAAAFGLQSAGDRSNRAATVVLVLVAGLSKNEGLVTALALVALVAARSIGIEGLRGGWRRWRWPLAVAVAEVVVLAWWPVLMHAVGARGASSTFTTSNGTGARVTAVVHGMSPYLHVLVLALPLSVVGGLALTGVRRRTGTGNDLWAWLALAVGLVAVGGALVTGTGAIVPWIRSTVHRITEYPILQAWWIVAVWAVVASSGIVAGRHPIDPAPAHAGLDPAETDDERDLASTTPVGARA